jgi:excisionase family DNA binding protein
LAEELTIGCEAQTEMHGRLWDIHEAARYLAISVSTLYGWVWQRRIAFVKVGRALRFDPLDLVAFIEANKQRPKQEIPTTQPHTSRRIRTRLAKGREEAASGNLQKRESFLD